MDGCTLTIGHGNNEVLLGNSVFHVGKKPESQFEAGHMLKKLIKI